MRLIGCSCCLFIFNSIWLRKHQVQ